MVDVDVLDIIVVLAIFGLFLSFIHVSRQDTKVSDNESLAVESITQIDNKITVDYKPNQTRSYIFTIPEANNTVLQASSRNTSGRVNYYVEDNLARSLCGDRATIQGNINKSSELLPRGSQTIKYNCTERFQNGPYASPNIMPYQDGKILPNEFVLRGETVNFMPNYRDGEHQWTLLVGSVVENRSNSTSFNYTFERPGIYTVRHQLSTEKRISNSSLQLEVLR